MKNENKPNTIDSNRFMLIKYSFKESFYNSSVKNHKLKKQQ